jgi:PcfJ-like protein
MEFQLPSNLQQHLVKYDPELKKVIAAAKPKVIRNNLGLPDDLIPPHIISKEELLQAVTNINADSVEDRYRVFRSAPGLKAEDTGKVKAIIYHIKSLWVAAWLPKPGEDYIYGISFAFKPGAFKKITIPYRPIHGSSSGADVETIAEYGRLFNMDNVISRKYGRINFCTWTDYITRDDIEAGLTTPYWADIPTGCYYKVVPIIHGMKLFTDQLKQTIPRWKDDGVKNIFRRLDLKTNNYTYILRLSEDRPSVPGVEMYQSYLDDNNKHILDTPWFKRYINTKAQKIIDAFNHPDTESPDVLLDMHKDIKKLLTWLNLVLNIWPACPVDYLQTAISNDVFRALSIYSLWPSPQSPDLVKAWLNTYLPVESFFKIITKFTEEWLSQYENPSHRDICDATFTSLRDTIAMLDQILTADQTIDPPKRWRIEEFHDHIQTKAWAIKNPNQDLPQDLFPTPIKVLDEEQTWTFFQPKDTHQLSHWGQAVRNCVGTSDSYASNVKAKKVFIVLCMHDNKPLFTVQLRVANGLMSVDQITGLSNARLSVQEKERYTQVFAQALKQREDELKS